MLLVGYPMPDRSRMMTQTKRDTLVLQFGGLGMRLTTPPHKKILLRVLKRRPRPTQGCRADDDYYYYYYYTGTSTPMPLYPRREGPKEAYLLNRS
jgi:hypothetical protein